LPLLVGAFETLLGALLELSRGFLDLLLRLVMRLAGLPLSFCLEGRGGCGILGGGRRSTLAAARGYHEGRDSRRAPYGR
jgi:hypothetical protein